MNKKLPFSVVIRWSDEDQCFIAQLPEFGPGAKTHGDTYAQAAKNAQEVLEMLVESYIADGEPLPKPNKYVDVGVPALKRTPRRRLTPLRKEKSFH